MQLSDVNMIALTLLASQYEHLSHIVFKIYLFTVHFYHVRGLL